MGSWGRSLRRLVVGSAALAMIGAGCGSSSHPKTAAPTTAAGSATGGSGLTASDKGVTPSTITLGLLSSFTGVFASTFSDTAAGARARIDLQNAQGGVDGRKLVLVTADDESTLQSTQSAVSVLLSKNLFGVMGFSGFLVGGAYKPLQQAGVPVTGGAFDGPEWGQPPNTNMFTYTGGLDPHYPASTVDGEFLKQVGAHSVAGLAYNNPSSSASIKEQAESNTAAGLKNCYLNTSIPNGAVDMTVPVLAIKSSHCDAVVGSFVDATDIALSTALRNEGLNVKQLYYTGYDQNTLDNASARQAAQGDYFVAQTVPLMASFPGAATFLNALKTYDPSYKGGIPDFGLIGGWLSTDLMIKGLELAGKNPTRQAFITNLRQLTSYDAGGLLPGPVSFASFGHLPASGCAYFMQLQGAQFVVGTSDGKPVCGHPIPNSNTV